MYYTTIKLEKDFLFYFIFAKMVGWEAMYWSAAKIDGRAVGTLALPIFNQSN